MSDWWPFDRSWAEEWRRGLSGLMAAGDPLALTVDTARTWLTGKERTFRVGGRDVRLTLTDLSVEPGDVARMVGQYGTVRVAARDVRWDDHRLERLELRARNVHLRPGARPTVVAAPVHAEALVPASSAAAWLAAASPRLELVHDAPVPQIGVAGLPWLRLEVEPGAEGRSIQLRPRALRVLDRRVPLRCPAFSVPLPKLPSGFLLTSVEPAPGGFAVRGLFSEWQRALTRDGLERLLTAMRAGQGRVDV
jgi:hypothetical protein